LIMRHGEKPADPLQQDVAPEGRERADRLASYIPQTFGKPDFLFASAASKHSRRPIETLEPLAAQCGLTIDETYADQDYGALAYELRKDAKYDGALIVVCWHHGNIPNMMHALKADPKDYPDPWDRDVFNLILRVDMDHSGQRLQVSKIVEPF
jgi:broad specificity phosphatase PhoE